MATIGNTNLTLTDWAKAQDPDGSVAAVVELLSMRNTLIDDATFVEGNLPTGHQYVQRTGLPDVYYRKINQGVPSSKATTAQVTEEVAMLEARGELDVDLAALNGNTAQYRLQQSAPFIEAMRQKVEYNMFYGETNGKPEEFNGLGIRYNSLSGASSSRNVINGGGSGSDNASIWLVCWSASGGVSGVFPKGSKAGIEHTARQAAEDVTDSTGNKFEAYVDLFKWKHGLVVEDWRQAARICNIDVSNLETGSNAADLIQLMGKATRAIENKAKGNCYFYMNREMIGYLENQAYSNVKAGGGLTYKNFSGEEIPVFRGIPIHQTDALITTEAAIS